jgi:hypothetical protein
MAKEKADTNKQGWLARWRERRKRNKLRASEIERRAFDARHKDQSGSRSPVVITERQVPRPREGSLLGERRIRLAALASTHA